MAAGTRGQNGEHQPGAAGRQALDETGSALSGRRGGLAAVMRAPAECPSGARSSPPGPPCSARYARRPRLHAAQRRQREGVREGGLRAACRPSKAGGILRRWAVHCRLAPPPIPPTHPSEAAPHPTHWSAPPAGSRRRAAGAAPQARRATGRLRPRPPPRAAPPPLPSPCGSAQQQRTGGSGRSAEAMRWQHAVPTQAAAHPHSQRGGSLRAVRATRAAWAARVSRQHGAQLQRRKVGEGEERAGQLGGKAVPQHRRKPGLCF